jgi:Uma2 family endonuclease
MTEEEFRAFSLGDGKGQWELVGGELRERPVMGVRHGGVMETMVMLLHQKLDRKEYRLRIQHARLRRSADTYYIPDIAVIPKALVMALFDLPGETLDAYPESLPLAIEIWSPSTGRYDIREKLPDYQARGDLEIWYIHPYERTLTAWRRQSDGSYSETIYTEGIVRPESLPDVAIDLEELFEP